MGKARNALSCALAAVAICLAAAAPAAGHWVWGASWGSVNAVPEMSGENDTFTWDTHSQNALLGVEAHVRHSCELGFFQGDASDQEFMNPAGDGYVHVGPLVRGDLAEVTKVEARAATAQFLQVVMDDPQDVFSYAHDNSHSYAEGFGSLDNLFRVDYSGPGEPPPSKARVTFHIQGSWWIEADSHCGEDTWVVQWAFHASVYDESGTPVNNVTDGSVREGAGRLEATRFPIDTDIQADVTYGIWYAFHLDASGETEAHAVPEPATLLLLAAGGLAVCRRSRQRAAA